MKEKIERIDEILACVEKNFEGLTISNVTLSDINEIAFQFLELISVTVVFFSFLLYVFLSEKSPGMFFAIIATYVAFVALIVTTLDVRERLFSNVVLLHNLKIIRKSYSDTDLYEMEYPIIKSLAMIKLKHPEISLLRIHELNKKMFTTERLISFLYDGNTFDQFNLFKRKSSNVDLKSSQTSIVLVSTNVNGK